MLLDLGGARVGVLSRLFEDREWGRQGKVPCTQSSKNMKMHLWFIHLLSAYLSTDPGSGERGQDVPPRLLSALCNVQYHQHQKSLTANINDMYLTTGVSCVFLWPLTMISSTGTCGWRRCRTSPQGNRRPRRSLNKHSDFLNKHLRLSKYEDIKIWGWWRFKKISPNLHWPSSRSQYCNTSINNCLEILLFSDTLVTHFWSKTDNLVKPNTAWNNKHLFHSWAVSRLKAAISLQNLALSVSKRWRNILLIIKYINNVFISW